MGLFYQVTTIDYAILNILSIVVSSTCDNSKFSTFGTLAGIVTAQILNVSREPGPRANDAGRRRSWRYCSKPDPKRLSMRSAALCECIRHSD
jgi:hypothetical protein